MKTCLCGSPVTIPGALCIDCRAMESALVASFGEDVDKVDPSDPDLWRQQRDDDWMERTYSL